MTTIEEIRERLSEVRPPRASGSIVDLDMVGDIRLDGGRVSIEFRPPDLPAGMTEALVADIKRTVGALDGVSEVEIHIASAEGGAFADVGPLPGVTYILAVSSAKGGVGKSTVAINLACALARMEQRVGLLDADVYGPSMPMMVGLSERPQAAGEDKIRPLEKYGLKLMSMGFFLDDDTPVIWRGAMVTGLVRQFLKDVLWGDLDVLVVDLPPGTGDAQLTLVQHVPVSGGVIVTTPQQVSLADVERGVAMFQRVNAPVLGVVENMSTYVCPNCGNEETLFGSGGGSRISESFGVRLLGHVPRVGEVRIGGDTGKPVVLDRPHDPVSRTFMDIARSVLDLLVATHREEAGPRIVG